MRQCHLYRPLRVIPNQGQDVQQAYMGTRGRRIRPHAGARYLEARSGTLLAILARIPRDAARARNAAAIQASIKAEGTPPLEQPPARTGSACRTMVQL